jgi:low affinity Fe/Cu permease
VNDVEMSDDLVAQRRQRLDMQVREGLSQRRRSGVDEATEGPDRPHRSWSSHVLHRLGRWGSRAAAGVTVACTVAAWCVFGLWVGFPHWWETVLYSTTASVTVVMVFAIQHTQSREQLVTQRKLDELLRAQPGADDHLIAAEVASDEELDALASLNADDRRLAESDHTESDHAEL